MKLSARMKFSDVRTLMSILQYRKHTCSAFKLCRSTAACTVWDVKMPTHELQTSMTSLQHLSGGLQNCFAANVQRQFVPQLQFANCRVEVTCLPR